VYATELTVRRLDAETVVLPAPRARRKHPDNRHNDNRDNNRHKEEV